ncbi:MAG: PAS domain S-box protein [Dongiaceae bacterium]
MDGLDSAGTSYEFAKRAAGGVGVWLACGLYLAALALSHALATALGNVPVFWPPAAIAMATFLSTDRRQWWMTAVFMAVSGALAGQIGAGGALAGLLISTADIAVGIAGSLLFQRLNAHKDMLTRLRTLADLFLVAALVATAHATATVWISADPGSPHFYQSWTIRWAAVALGLLLATPLAAGFLPQPDRLARWRPSGSLILPATLALGSTAVAYLAWPGHSDVPLVVALTSVPFLVWIAVTCSTLEAAAVLAAVSVLELCLAVAGYGPTADPDWPSDVRILWLQFLLLARGGTILMLCSAIAARRQVEIIAEDQSTRLQSMVEAVPDAIITIDERGLITFFSTAAERMFQYRAEEVVGQNVKILMPMPYQSEHDGYLSRYLRTGEKRIIGIGRIVVGRRKDGSTFPIELAVGEALSKGGHIFTGLIRDISERQETERRLHEVQDDLIHVSRLSAMGELASALAHELNQPLTAISNYLLAARQLVQRGPEHAERAMDIIGRSIDQAARAGRIIRQLRQFVQKREVERTPSEIDKVVDEASALAFIGLKEKGIHVTIERQGSLLAVPVDRIQIQQVLINLIRNAVDAMEGMERRDLTITIALHDNHVRISVIDTGTGIATDMHEKMFQAFATTKPAGMGVGLSISRNIVEAHGGRLWFEPNPDGGTIFHLDLPLTDGQAG